MKKILLICILFTLVSCNSYNKENSSGKNSEVKFEDRREETIERVNKFVEDNNLQKVIEETTLQKYVDFLDFRIIQNVENYLMYLYLHDTETYLSEMTSYIESLGVECSTNLTCPIDVLQKPVIMLSSDAYANIFEKEELPYVNLQKEDIHKYIDMLVLIDSKLPNIDKYNYSSEEKFLIMSIYGDIANLYAIEGEYEEANKYKSKIVKISEEINAGKSNEEIIIIDE